MSILRTENLTRSFGSLVVTNKVSLAIEPGERHVIIGPNGAGKTSFLNQIGGQLRPSSGRILLQEKDVTGLAPEQMCRRGVARTFQKNSLFRDLTVIENVRLAVQARRGRPLNFYTPVSRSTALIDAAHRALALTGLADTPERLVRALSYGEQRQLEVAIALASEPEILLLDEPTSGMSPSETARMIDLIGELPRSLTLLMIEHDMQVVFSLADRITVLYYGEVLATSTPQEISDNAQVREVYLGTRH